MGAECVYETTTARNESRIAPPSSASSDLATSVFRSPSNSRRRASMSSATTSASACAKLLMARRVAHPGRSGVARSRRSCGAARSRRRRTRIALARSRRDLDRRADAAVEDARPGHELRDRGGRRGDASGASRTARRAREHDVSGHDARSVAAGAHRARASSSARMSSSRSVPSASIRAIRSITRRTRPRWSAASRRRAPSSRRRSTTAASTPRAGVVARGRGTRQAAREHVPLGQHRAW